jgi:hypothetical protein
VKNDTIDTNNQGGMMDCDHANVALKWGFDKDMNFSPILWGCSRCDAKSADRFPDIDVTKVDHSNCDIEQCFSCKIQNISFGSGTAPTRRAGAEVVEAREKRWNKDMPAYKALRAQGLQPPRIDGSAELMAKAETRFEVESGKIMPGQAKAIESTVNAFESVTGKSVYQPNTTPVNL